MNKDNLVPDLTSAEALETYPAGLKIAGGEGDAWKEIKVSLFSLDSDMAQYAMPGIPEPFLVWIISGEAETMERESENDKWKVSKVTAGSLYLTAAAVPYQFKWRRLSSEPFRVMLVILSLPLFELALSEVYGEKSKLADMQDLSGFEDPKLVQLLSCLRQEVKQTKASKLYVQGIAQAIAVYLARNYVTFAEVSKEASKLPGYILKKITEWMKDNITEEFSLPKLAQQARISEFHFTRLFKKAMGLPPSQYHIRLRLDQARKLLRETDLTILEITNAVGYSNPSHFARLFRKETGLTPREYRGKQ
ncbi:MAG: AraC family transcriptional regulator [Gammaproteobacteria bacterium]|nr:AraC family transcriptional regulator [Gammaproteobacteria bacterium]